MFCVYDLYGLLLQSFCCNYFQSAIIPETKSWCRSISDWSEGVYVFSLSYRPMRVEYLRNFTNHRSGNSAIVEVRVGTWEPLLQVFYLIMKPKTLTLLFHENIRSPGIHLSTVGICHVSICTFYDNFHISDLQFAVSFEKLKIVAVVIQKH